MTDDEKKEICQLALAGMDEPITGQTSSGEKAMARMEALGREAATAFVKEILQVYLDKLETPGLRVVCTALPGPGDACVFVELEDANGRSLRREWEARPDGLVHLLVTP